MLRIPNAIDAASVMCGGYSLLQARQLYLYDIERMTALHEESKSLENEQHMRDILIMKLLYLMEGTVDLVQHFQQLNADLIASFKESERDIFDQRNQQLQTTIVASSVMFSALATAVTQGSLVADRQVPQVLFIIYAIFTAISFSSLLISIVICIEIITTASSFMVAKASYLVEVLTDAIGESRRLMYEILKDTGAGNNRFEIINISPQSDEKLRDLWSKHEATLNEFLRNREQIINNIAAMRQRKKFKVNSNNNINANGEEEHANLIETDDPKRESFEDFWYVHCQWWSDLSLYSFYIGTASLMASVAVYMYVEFNYKYDRITIGASISIGFISFALLFGCFLMIRMRFDGIIPPPSPLESINVGGIDLEKIA